MEGLMLDETSKLAVKEMSEQLKSHFLAYADSNRELDAKIAIKFFGWRWMRWCCGPNANDFRVTLYPANAPGWQCPNLPDEQKYRDDVTEQYESGKLNIERGSDWDKAGRSVSFTNCQKWEYGIPNYSSNAGCSIVLAELAKNQYVVMLKGNPISGYEFTIHVISSDPSWDPIAVEKFQKWEEFGQAVCRAALKVV